MTTDEVDALLETLTFSGNIDPEERTYNKACKGRKCTETAVLKQGEVSIPIPWDQIQMCVVVKGRKREACMCELMEMKHARTEG